MGAWYTPPSLVAHVVANTIDASVAGSHVRIIDPACGDGRFLLAAAAAVRAHGGTPLLTGVDIDADALSALSAASAAAGESVEIIGADALAHDWAERRFDVIIGNPPFLSPLAATTARAGGSRFGGGTYADTAADFVGLALRLARADGGRVGLVLPVSLLTSRDAGPIRRDALASAALSWFWSAPGAMFDAAVRTCAVGMIRGEVTTTVRRAHGPSFAEVAASTPPSADGLDHWGWLLADAFGVPAPPDALHTTRRLADIAVVTANFRDQYYGLVGAVRDDADGPPLITTGLIDPGVCHWGARPTRFAKQRFAAPRVDRAGLAPFMQRWADRCLVPKVLVATQTRILEAVVDPSGDWLPAVPMIRIVPREVDDLWAVAAVLTSPVASASIAHQSVGSGMSAMTMRVSQRTVGALAWPAGDLRAAVTALRDGDLASCGRLVDAAYGIDDGDDEHAPRVAWWLDALQTTLSAKR